jgi:hypothetical protein
MIKPIISHSDLSEKLYARVVKKTTTNPLFKNFFESLTPKEQHMYSISDVKDTWYIAWLENKLGGAK